MVMALLVSLMGRSFKVVSIKGSQSMASLHSMINVIMLAIFNDSKHQETAHIKILKMGTTMKDNGRRICNMVLGYKNMLMETIIKANLCAGVNLDKESINLQTVKIIKGHSIMDTVMDMVS